CGITPPELMRGLDLRDPQALAKRDRVFVDVYQHDSNLDQLDDIDSGLDARVVIDGWDKLIARPEGKELYDLKNDPDDRHNIATQNPEKVQKLSSILEDWLKETPPAFK
ncbi:MAG: N-acetylgalactosamine-6-sulfatase, partial [Coraliomargarita sp.]